MPDQKAEQLIQEIEAFLARPFADFGNTIEFKELHRQAINKLAQIQKLPDAPAQQKIDLLSECLKAHRKNWNTWQTPSRESPLLSPGTPETPNIPEPLVILEVPVTPEPPIVPQEPVTPEPPRIPYVPTIHDQPTIPVPVTPKPPAILEPQATPTPPVIPETPVVPVKIVKEPPQPSAIYEQNEFLPEDAAGPSVRRAGIPLLVMIAVFVLTGLITFSAVFLLLTRGMPSDISLSTTPTDVEVTSVPTYTPIILVVTAIPGQEAGLIATIPLVHTPEPELPPTHTPEPPPPPTYTPEPPPPPPTYTPEPPPPPPTYTPEPPPPPPTRIPEPPATQAPVRRVIEQPAIISRSDWGATAPDGNSNPQVPDRILLSHDGQDTQGVDPVVLIQRIQRIHKERWVDIAWHYIIDLDGNIYTGRDLQQQTNSGYIPNTEGMIVIGVLGDYDTQTPSQRQIDAIAGLMAWLCDEYKISPDEIYPFREFARQADPDITSPGRNFDMNEIRWHVRDMLE